MPKKFYHAENAGRPFPDGLRFTIYDIAAGTAWGVLATEADPEIAVLDKLASEKASAVTSITEDEYNECLKKKAPRFDALNRSPLRLSSPVTQPMAIKGSGNVEVVDGKEQSPVVEVHGEVESAEDALKTAAAEGSQPESPAKGKKLK